MNPNYFMSRLSFIVLLFFSPSILAAQSIGPALPVEVPAVLSFAAAEAVPGLPPAAAPIFAPPVSVPRMSAELALETYLKQASRQSQALAGYSAATLIRAALPASSQHGEFELERRYTAPRSLAFKPLHYEGDGFVKTNVIARLLQSEVDHVQKDDPSTTALGPENYKFSHKNTAQVAGRTVHVFQVKPRKKRPGLFKGQIYLDACTGSLVRVEGRVVKSPSLFVKKIDFVQDYADVNGFTFPVRMHSEAKAALVGRTIVDIENRDYQPVPSPLESATASGSY
jgi:hypothetical protein